MARPLSAGFLLRGAKPGAGHAQTRRGMIRLHAVCIWSAPVCNCLRDAA